MRHFSGHSNDVLYYRPPGEDGFILRVERSSGGWSAPRNLGDAINTSGDETWPILSPDGKYLFFCRGGEDGFDPYWVDATVLGPAGE